MRKVFFVSACLAFGLVTVAMPSQAKDKAVATAVKKPVGKPAAKYSDQRPHSKRTASKQEALLDAAGNPALHSSSALVLDQDSGEILFEKNAQAQVPIASLTKLMTAMVVLDAQLDMEEELTIDAEDVAATNSIYSRLRIGTHLTRAEMLRLALMSSENRAAAALSRNYPGGRTAFIADMNRKAAELELTETRFADPTGLTPANVSSAHDLGRLAAAAYTYFEIREFSTTLKYDVQVGNRIQTFYNTNQLVSNDGWDIGLSKTGYIHQAGKCLIMQTTLNDTPVIIVLLDSWGKLTRIADANRIKYWLEQAAPAQPRNLTSS
jgi:D-alanyl-D-alanine endopeptidase (penicillin-binding protein 7)